MADNVQDSVLRHLRARDGIAETVESLARRVFATERPTDENKRSLMQALEKLSSYPYFLVVRGKPLKPGGMARWKIPGGVDATEPLRPRKPQRSAPPYRFKYRSTGRPTHRDDLEGQFELGLSGGSGGRPPAHQLSDARRDPILPVAQRGRGQQSARDVALGDARQAMAKQQPNR